MSQPIESQGILVSSSPHPFKFNTFQWVAGEGLTIQQIVEQAQPNPVLRESATVLLGDVEVPRAYWHAVRPKRGTRVAVVMFPQGGGEKDPVRTFLTIAVVVAAAATGQYWAAEGVIASSLASTAVGYVGMRLVNQIAPLALPEETPMERNSRESTNYALTGASNALNPYGRVPVVLGKRRITPPHAARPYTEIVGNEQWVRLLLSPGYGQLFGDRVSIGETAIVDEDTGKLAFPGLEWDYTDGTKTRVPELFANDVYEESVGAELLQTEGWHRRTTQPNCSELVCIFTAPRGVYRINDNGDRVFNTVELEMRYRRVGDTTWRYASPNAERNGVDMGYVPHFTQEEYDEWAANNETYLVDKLGVVSIDNDTGELRIRTQSFGFLTIPDNETEICRFPPIAGATPTPTDTRPIGFDGYTPSRSDVVQAVYIGAGTKQGANPLLVRERTSAAVRRSVRINLLATPTTTKIGQQRPEPGQFEVEVRRKTADHEDVRTTDTMYWTSLQTITHSSPVELDGVALLAMRVPAGSKLTGRVDKINLVASSVMLDWDKDSGKWVKRKTSNPASVYRYVHQGPFNPEPVADSELDLPTLQAWHEQCDANGWTFNYIVDKKITLRELKQMIASAGRASPTRRNQKHSVVREREIPSAKQAFTPRNSWNYKFEKDMGRPVHGLKVKFVNAAEGYRDDEVIAYDDGYNAGNAANIETINMPFVDNADLAWKHGRYHLAVLKLRGTTHTLEVGMAHLACERGDRVRVVHDVPLWSISSARVKEVSKDGNGDVTNIVLDAPVTMEASKNYGAEAVLGDGTFAREDVVTQEGQTDTLTYTTPLSADVRVGDLIMFGESEQEAVDLLITRIERISETNVRIGMVDYAPAVRTADSGTIPDHNPQMTLPPELRKPPAPVVANVRSDESVLLEANDGSLITRMAVEVARAGSEYEVVETDWQIRALTNPPAKATTITLDKTTTVTNDGTTDTSSGTTGDTTTDTTTDTTDGDTTTDEPAGGGTVALPPEVADWESNMITYGQQWGQYIIDNMGTSAGLNATYYDAEWIYYQIMDYTGDGSWQTYADAAEEQYVVRYCEPNDFLTPGYWRFPHGIYEDWRRVGNLTLTEVQYIRDNPAYSAPEYNDTTNWYHARYQRDISYALLSNVLAEKAGLDRISARMEFLPILENHLYQMRNNDYLIDGATLFNGDYDFMSPWMFALVAHALIDFYEWEVSNGRNPDQHFTDIPGTIEDFADWMYNTATVQSGTDAGKAMWVPDLGGQSGAWDDTGGAGFGAFRYRDNDESSPAPDLSLLIAPVYAWLYKRTGNTTYRSIADAVFIGGVRGAAIAYGGGKIFNQNYRWSFAYVQWRTEGDELWNT